ncbi:MAG TPA: tyrosine-type recombinase/integrase [Rugosimonospora sp.]|nr:tyrosine-type recombinase/integrase [Rugosimonospora sp.]
MHDLIGAYLAHLIASGAADKTLRLRAQLLRRLNAELPGGLLAATTHELVSWLGHPGWARWTLCTYYETVVAFYNWACAGRRPFLPENPTEGLRRPRPPKHEPRPATEQQLAQALRLLSQPWRRAIMLAAFCGLRCGEIARLRREDITADTLHVERKGERSQELPVHTRVWAEVAELPHGLVVTRRSGQPYDSNGLSSAASRALAGIGLNTLSLHKFRHRYATIMLLPAEWGGVGADIRTVQELMGHASLETTQAYIAVTDRQRRQAVAAIPVPTFPTPTIPAQRQPEPVELPEAA